MKIRIGDKIRELRRRDDRRQEDLANALGVTCQAVSRWESDTGYPDMELIPAIANYFGITIDELFGYESDRDAKIDAIIARVDAYGIKSRGDDEWVDECLSILREGLAEFPRSEKLMLALADTLSEAGWRRHKEWLYYDDEGYICHNYDVHKKNEYWSESVKLCEYLCDNAKDSAVMTKAVSILVLLLRNFGENDRAISYAMRMPALGHCRELMLASACDGKREARYIGEFLLKAADEFADQLVYGLVANRHHYESDLPIDKICGVIALFDMLCDDGNYGLLNDTLIKLYLYLSRIQWERGYHDDAFVSLDKALFHARQLESLLDGNEHSYTAPLISLVKFSTSPLPHKSIAKQLPGDWPFWCNPDYSGVDREIKADKRWDDWVRRTQS